MSYIKLFLRYGSNNLIRKCVIERKVLSLLNSQFCFYCSSAKKALIGFDEKDPVFDKIIYSEVLGPKNFRKEKSQSNRPICLKYLLEEEENKTQEYAIENKENPEIVHFPYEPERRFSGSVESDSIIHSCLPQTLHNFTPSDNEEDTEFEWNSKLFRQSLKNLEDPRKWTVQDSDGLEIDDSDTKFEFGSFDPNKPVSNIPCGGCGALLHCSDPAIPGFIPLEAFENKTREELRGEICQRCVFLKELDVALGVNIKTCEYSKIINAIKEKEALIILLIDLLDMPCSIYPDILNLIGPKPIVVVGNKADLLINDGPWFLNQFKASLIQTLRSQNFNLQNVKHVSLISAKTGYGIEDLVDVLYNNWGYDGDIYLIGCTNSGKSTLFNILIRSDLCKIRAVDVLQRATVSPWPGTTLNLLKFPIARPARARMVARSMRLKIERRVAETVEKVQWLGQNIKLEQIPVKGYINRTDKGDPNQMVLDYSDNSLRKGLDPTHNEFLRGYWFYDTPGVVHADQLVNLLTTAELLLTVPKKMLLPRNFHLSPGDSLFIGGLARLDYIKGAEFVWFTVFASMELPLTVTKLEHADYVYEKLLGSPLFRVPMKGEERLSKWPKLSSKKLQIVGKLPKGTSCDSWRANSEPKQADADVVLSSAGWVSVNVPLGYRCLLEAWTPEGRGIHLREIPLIRFGHTFKGKKIRGTPAFTTVVKEVQELSSNDIHVSENVPY